MKKRPLIFAILFFLLTGAGLFFLLREIRVQDAMAEETLAAWQKESAKRDDVRSLERSVKMIEPEMLMLESHFARSSDIVPFLDTLEGLAAKAGAKAEVTSVDTSKEEPTLLVGMKASGSFDSLYKFLTLLENSPYELRFESWNMERADASGKMPTWEATMRLELLSFVKDTE